MSNSPILEFGIAKLLYPQTVLLDNQKNPYYLNPDCVLPLILATLKTMQRYVVISLLTFIKLCNKYTQYKGVFKQKTGPQLHNNTYFIDLLKHYLQSKYLDNIRIVPKKNITLQQQINRIHYENYKISISFSATELSGIVYFYSYTKRGI